ncbi:MAG: sugar phosphate nucleotidyltransferase, partial [Patescibacteria group bacterium]
MYVLILAGGGGTRLWPLSRENSPKQFLKIFDGKSLFELTLARAEKLVPFSRIFISTSAKYVSLIRKEAPGIPPENIISEPMRRDTALAMGFAAKIIYKQDPLAVILNCPSDHLIKPESTYVSEIKKAATVAYEKQKYVVVGKKPEYAHPGYGHIKIKGEKRPDGSFLGDKYIEKPPLDKAKEYAQRPNYFWNVGQYIWPAKLLLDLLKKHAPKTYSQLPKVLASLGT